MTAKHYKLKNFHFLLVIYMLLLTGLGIMIIGSAEKSDQSKQLLGLVLGFSIMIILSLIDYSFLLRFSWLFYFGIVGLLIGVELFGETTGGSQRWISIAGIRFQPSELAKIVLILFFAYWFMKFQEKINKFYVLILSFLVASVPMVLVLIQPDTSTTIVLIFIFAVLLFLAGLSYKIVLTVAGITIPASIIGITYLFQHAQELIADGHYQVKRIMSWLDPSNALYSETATQQQNSIMAIGSGQFWGKGLNNSVSTSMKNANYIIEPQTDFIFAVAGEELGFIGTIAIISLLFLICLECIIIAVRARDLAGRLISCGMASLIAFQAFVNLCVATGLMPNTGVTLPFVSYGLTSLVSLYIGMGVVLNIGLQPKSQKKGGIL